MPRRFRTTMMHQAGADPAIVVQGRVVNYNLVNYTIDVISTFDRKRYFDIQVGSPYLHYSNGEGMSVMPEVGAQCMVCIPGDSSPPFVFSFLMPHELSQSAASDAPSGTRSHGNIPQNATDASFAGGRPRIKPGDIFIRGRDDNFVILHRGGVLQIGATELAQRIYIPLGNLVTDISGTYQHFNSGGAEVWGIQEGPSESNIPSQNVQTFRVFANNKYADIKIAKGKVFNPMPDSDGGQFQSKVGVAQGDNNFLIYEVSVCPQGFVVETGDTASSGTSRNSVLRFVFDQQGNTLFRCDGNLGLKIKGKILIDCQDDITVTGSKSLSFTVQNGAVIDGGSYAHVKGSVVLLGPGAQPVARLGDLVSVFISMLPATIIPLPSIPPPVLAPGVPINCTLSVGAPPTGLPPVPISGFIQTGEYTVKA